MSAPERLLPCPGDAGIRRYRGRRSLAIHRRRSLHAVARRAESLRSRGAADNPIIRHAPRFPISRAAELVGRTSAAIRDAEKDGRLPAVERTASGRRVAYTLAEINQMREVFGTRPWRTADDPLAVIAVQNFKGGVGKSTVASHLAQYLAIKGYRVCLIDCDSQGSSTALFGYVPDLDIQEDGHALSVLPPCRDGKPRLRGAGDPLGRALSVPANLHLYSAEYELAARVARAEPNLLNRLAEGIASIGDHFDVVILDPPPALGTISLSVMRAANALLVPIPPTVIDFTSTTSFFAMLHETMQTLEERQLPIDLRWLRLLATRADEQKSMQRELLGLMREPVRRSAVADCAQRQCGDRQRLSPADDGL